MDDSVPHASEAQQKTKTQSTNKSQFSFLIPLLVLFVTLVVFASIKRPKFVSDQTLSLYAFFSRQLLVFLCASLSSLFCSVAVVLSVFWSSRLVSGLFVVPFVVSVTLQILTTVYCLCNRYAIWSLIIITSLVTIVIHLGSFLLKIKRNVKISVLLLTQLIFEPKTELLLVSLSVWLFLTAWYYLCCFSFTFSGDQILRYVSLLVNLILWTFSTGILGIWIRFLILTNKFSLRNGWIALGISIKHFFIYPKDYWYKVLMKENKIQIGKIRMWRFIKDAQLLEDLEDENLSSLKYLPSFPLIDLFVTSIIVIVVIVSVLLSHLTYHQSNVPYFLTLWVLIYALFISNFTVNLLIDFYWMPFLRRVTEKIRNRDIDSTGIDKIIQLYK